MAGEEHYVYLTSLGNRDIFSNNTPNAFENRLEPHILLDPNKDYEVALVKAHYPRMRICIPRGDYKSRIEVWGQMAATPDSPSPSSTLICTYIPKTDIEVGDVKYMIDILNNELAIELREKMKTKYERYFPTDEFFAYDERLRRLSLLVRKKSAPDRHLRALGVRFGSRMAEVLGFEQSPKYSVYESNTHDEDGLTSTPAPYLPRNCDGGVDYALIFADCVTPTHYGDQKVNLLEIITMESTGGGDHHHVTYKPLNKTHLDAIAIKVTDQNGRPIHFGGSHPMTVLLHIRPK